MRKSFIGDRRFGVVSFRKSPRLREYNAEYYDAEKMEATPCALEVFGEAPKTACEAQALPMQTRSVCK